MENVLLQKYGERRIITLQIHLGHSSLLITIRYLSTLGA